MPSYEQLYKVAQICQSFSAMLLPIQVFFYDDEQQKFYIIAGFKGNLTVNIDTNRDLRFKDEIE